ncbi:uncharacterized protein LOC123876167 [Maniola jurtina]|uniref:uncharacterized protein LOC123876167 n=1 Tax=Maniola jurtina TaxID=191418 RepID=UPI001E6897AC|nr:uncharacterized protein LOC123876167 [Maniola jurtina]
MANKKNKIKRSKREHKKFKIQVMANCRRVVSAHKNRPQANELDMTEIVNESPSNVPTIGVLKNVGVSEELDPKSDECLAPERNIKHRETKGKRQFKKKGD